MADYLFKTEPSDYPFAKLVDQGGGVWDGVRNKVALRNLKSIAQGDRVFVYHTGSEKAVVGLAKAASVAYPDPKAAGDTSLFVIDLLPGKALPRAVTLATLKARSEFSDSALVRQGRLSVVALTPEQSAVIEKLGGLA